MQRTYKIIIILFLVTGLLVLGYIFISYNYTTPKVEKLDTQIKIDASDLVNSFVLNEAKADSVFVEKVIEIEGAVDKVTFKDNRNTIFLQTRIDTSYVICEMRKDQEVLVRSLKKDQKVIIKGICMGYLFDAIVLNCILVADE